MILSNRGIQKALDTGRLVIRPEPQPRRPTVEHPNCPYNTTAVDLRLGRYLSIPRSGAFTYDLRRGGVASLLAAISDNVELSPNGHTIEPGGFVLGQTLEYVALQILRKARPLAARIEGRSSFARCGLLVHFTAPTVHAGFEGHLTLEMANLGRSPITIFPEEPICQLILEVVEDAPFENPSQFQGQETPAGTKHKQSAKARNRQARR